MRSKKLLPGCLLAAFRSRLNALLLKNVGDGAARYRVSQIAQRTLNPRVSPIAVPLRHADDKTSDLPHDSWPTGTSAVAAIIFIGDQLPMPTQQGLWGDDRGDILEHSPAEFPGFRSQTTALII